MAGSRFITHLALFVGIKKKRIFASRRSVSKPDLIEQRRLIDSATIGNLYLPRDMFIHRLMAQFACLSAVFGALQGREVAEDAFVPSNLGGPRLLEYNHVNNTLIYVSSPHRPMSIPYSFVFISSCPPTDLQYTTRLQVPGYHMEMNCTHITPPLPEWRQPPLNQPDASGVHDGIPSPTLSIDMQCTVFTRDPPGPSGMP